MDMILLCNESYNTNGIKDYLPALAVIFAALIAGGVAIIKIYLDAKTKKRLEWNNQFKDIASKFFSRNNHAINEFYSYVSIRIVNPNISISDDLKNYDKYNIAATNAGMLFCKLKLLLDGSIQSHVSAEELIDQQDKLIEDLYSGYSKEYQINSISDLNTILYPKVDEIRKMNHDILLALKKISNEEMKKYCFSKLV
jgi:hypothetical protein